MHVHRRRWRYVATIVYLKRGNSKVDAGAGRQDIKSVWPARKQPAISGAQRCKGSVWRLRCYSAQSQRLRLGQQAAGCKLDCVTASRPPPLLLTRSSTANQLRSSTKGVWPLEVNATLHLKTHAHSRLLSANRSRKGQLPLEMWHVPGWRNGPKRCEDLLCDGSKRRHVCAHPSVGPQR